MAPVILFFGSFVLLGAFFSMRYLEEKRGLRYYRALRARLDTYVISIARALYHARVPDEFKLAVKHAVRSLAHSGVVMLISFVRRAEQRLVAAADWIRHRPVHSKAQGTVAPLEKPTSAFLGAVVDHKNGLKKAVRKMAERIKPTAREER